MSEYVGQWFARYPNVRDINTPPIGKAHVCESEIAGAKITYCGERLEPVERTVFSATPEPKLEDRCKVCQHKRTGAVTGGE